MTTTVTVDVGGMAPLYQDLYAAVFAERLRLWGARTGAFVQRRGDLLVYGAAQDAMRPSPAERVAARLDAADLGWLEGLDRSWRAAADRLEASQHRLWTTLVAGHVGAEQLREVLADKAHLAAYGVDGLVPAPAAVHGWFAARLPGVPGDELAALVDGARLPTTGAVAFDALEAESWELAAATHGHRSPPEPARLRFVREAVFCTYAALDTDRREQLFQAYPRDTARRYGASAPTRSLLDARRGAVAARPWRRRLHRQWATGRLRERVPAGERPRLEATCRLLGTARDFDETKRRLNMPLWRSLFALADGLGVALRAPATTLDAICAELDHRDGRVDIDPVFRSAV